MSSFLSVRDLKVHFPTDDGLVRSVDGLSFAVDRGRTLGIVGESGSGKSVTSQAVLGLLARTNAWLSGEVWLDGNELVGAPPESVRHLRGREMAMIFQDPLSSMRRSGCGIPTRSSISMARRRATFFETLLCTR